MIWAKPTKIIDAINVEKDEVKNKNFLFLKIFIKLTISKKESSIMLLSVLLLTSSTSCLLFKILLISNCNNLQHYILL